MSLFKRRTKRSFYRNMREMIWPSMGWMRSIDYYYHRIFRTNDSTYKITMGLVTGMAVSHTPLLTMHMVQALGLAAVTRSSYIASAVGTLWGNPWTLPFFLTLDYKLGVWICEVLGRADFIALPDDARLEKFTNDPMAFMAFLFAHPVQFFTPMVIGGYVIAVLSIPVFYALLYYPVKRMQKAYRRQIKARKRLRRARRAQEAEAQGHDEHEVNVI
jgi:uncharacterized protein (DUF2062 family)